MGRLCYGAGDILIRERHIKSVIIFPRADFYGETFKCDTGSDPQPISLQFTAVSAAGPCCGDTNFGECWRASFSPGAGSWSGAVRGGQVRRKPRCEDK